MQINWIGPVNTLGYGITGLNILRELNKLHDVAYWPVNDRPPEVTNREDGLLLEGLMSNRESADLSAPCIKLWHQFDLSFPEFFTGPKIGFPIFELTTFNNQELSQLNNCDVLFVCSDWAKDVVAKHTDVPCKVVPLGVDSNLFKKQDAESEVPKVFFNCGKWEIRKGHDVLIQIWDRFCDKYEGASDWELWMMCQNPFNTPDEENKWRKTYKRDNIKLLPRVRGHEEVYNIMCQTGCGVFPSRAEGWNLELHEMMALGKYCVTTDYSAHTQFCNDKNSFLVKPEFLEPALDGKWFFGHGDWASIGPDEIDAFVEHMIAFAKNPKHLDDDFIKQFSWENSARKIEEYVEEINGEVGGTEEQAVAGATA